MRTLINSVYSTAAAEDDELDSLAAACCLLFSSKASNRSSSSSSLSFKGCSFCVYIHNENIVHTNVGRVCGFGKRRESDLRTTEEEGCKLLTIFSVFCDKPA